MAKNEFLKCATCGNNEAPIENNGVYICKYCKNQREQKPKDAEIVVVGDGNITMSNVHNSIVGTGEPMTFGEKVCHFIMMCKSGMIDTEKYKQVDTFLRKHIPASRIDKYDSFISKGDERDFWYLEIFLTAFSEIQDDFKTGLNEILAGIEIVTTSYRQAYSKNMTTTHVKVTGNNNQTFSNISGSTINIGKK